MFRDVYGHAVATLTRRFGDIGLAEDAVQDAFVIASDRWQRDGIPPNPHGWIVTTARRRGIDVVRRQVRGDKLERSAAQNGVVGSSAAENGPFDDATAEIEQQSLTDDRLALIFTCCHPSLRVEHQIALTLRLIGGLGVEEIAQAFLVSEAAMAKRLTRAKYKIAAASVPYRVPDGRELPQRIAAVLSVIYLIYNAAADAHEEQRALRLEAIRLARAVVELLPDQPEASGLLALLLLNDARMPARRRNGAIVVLRDQDRSRWTRSQIDEGHDLVRACIERDEPGPYQLQAAIQAVHCHAPTFETTDWPQIVGLYDHLYAISPTPVVAMNRAIAVMEADDPDAALELLGPLATQLDAYGPFHAALAMAFRRTDRIDDACRSYGRAAELARDDALRRHLLEQIEDLRQSP
ncbi:MAG: DUF6596 domain-containing protein [Acidimicrobiales bacterium]